MLKRRIRKSDVKNRKNRGVRSRSSSEYSKKIGKLNQNKNKSGSADALKNSKLGSSGKDLQQKKSRLGSSVNVLQKKKSKNGKKKLGIKAYLKRVINAPPNQYRSEKVDLS